LALPFVQINGQISSFSKFKHGLKIISKFCALLQVANRCPEMSIFRKQDPLQKAALASGMALFYAKYLGSISVSEVRGDAVVADAIARV
jgi:hypothetical protein